MWAVQASLATQTDPGLISAPLHECSMLKTLFKAAIAVMMASAVFASPAAAHEHGFHHWRPYVIEKVCDENYSHYDVRMDYAPGQHAGLAGPGSYWYQSTFHYRHHHRHYRMSRHVAWCLDHYRTYDPHSDTFVGRGYRRYRCNSPY